MASHERTSVGLGQVGSDPEGLLMGALEVNDTRWWRALAEGRVMPQFGRASGWSEVGRELSTEQDRRMHLRSVSSAFQLEGMHYLGR